MSIFVGRSQLFHLDLHSISNTFVNFKKIATQCGVETIFTRLMKATSDAKYKKLGQLYIFAIFSFVEGSR